MKILHYLSLIIASSAFISIAMDNPRGMPSTLSSIKIHNLSGKTLVVKTKSVFNFGKDIWTKPQVIEINGTKALSDFYPTGDEGISTQSMANLTDANVKLLKETNPNDICEIAITTTDWVAKEQMMESAYLHWIASKVVNLNWPHVDMADLETKLRACNASQRKSGITIIVTSMGNSLNVNNFQCVGLPKAEQKYERIPQPEIVAEPKKPVAPQRPQEPKTAEPRQKPAQEQPREKVEEGFELVAKEPKSFDPAAFERLGISTHSTPYQILGISPSASSAEAEKAYKVLTLRWHTDRQKNDPAANEVIKLINWAIEQIRNAFEVRMEV